MTCEYCQSAVVEAETKCENCGAPIVSPVLPDFRYCPSCHRRLLALGSPACNYCGRRLPNEYIRARAGDLKRVTEVEGECTTTVSSKVGEFLSESSRRKRSGSSALGLVDITSLFDLFS